MYFAQIYTPGLAHSSYALGGERGCIVVDPARDVERYLDQAKTWGKPIVAIIETHLHADFVSGHMELQRLTGATIYAPAAASCEFAHVALADEAEFTVDSFRIQMLEAPGHTPEGAVFVVSDLTRGPEPCMVFTGDTLLVGDVGRPDLFPDIKQDLAHKLFRSIRRLGSLSGHLEVYPAHGMGSLCGRQLSAKLWSTLGTERLHNYALRIADEEEFVKALLTGMPEAPDHFARCSAINRQGPDIVADMAAPKALAPAEFWRLAQHGHVVIDTRDQLAIAGAHVPESFAASLRGNFATFAGWVVPPDRPLLLVLETPSDLAPALTGLRRVGHDNVVGYLAGGMTAWANAGLPAGRFESIGVVELKQRHDAGELAIVDTRLRSEFDAGHVAGSVHIAAPDTRHEHPALRQDKTLAVLCNTGNRSVLAASLLRRRGFQNVINVIGGTTAWQAAGYPLTAPAGGAVAHD
jgi:glyoxylase-like metal-dependent hydrolase (beta-lactamase superfamily II)